VPVPVNVPVPVAGCALGTVISAISASRDSVLVEGGPRASHVMLGVLFIFAAWLQDYLAYKTAWLQDSLYTWLPGYKTACMPVDVATRLPGWLLV